MSPELRAAIEAHQARLAAAQPKPKGDDLYEVRYGLGPSGFPLGHSLVTGPDGQLRVEPYELGTSTAWFVDKAVERGVLRPCPGCGNVTCPAWGDECWRNSGCPSTPPEPKVAPERPPENGYESRRFDVVPPGSGPRSVTCPFCSRPAVERQFSANGGTVAVIECPCVPWDRVVPC